MEYLRGMGMLPPTISQAFMPYRRMTDHPDLERFMAKRMRAETIEVKAIPADAITFDPRSRAKLADGLPYRLGAAGNPAVPAPRECCRL